MSALLDTVFNLVKNDYELPDVIWENMKIKDVDIQFLNEECNKDSEFDPFNTRKQIYNNMLLGDALAMMCRCEYGQLFAILETPEQFKEIPLELWGRILRMFSNKSETYFKVYLLANTSLRILPPGTEPIQPQNINGGYTYRCNPETIVIYRAEDATRVLIHELQHSCCLDNTANNLDVIEAETEAWAELFYVAILSHGKKFIFNDLIKRQSEWMRKQNNKVRKHMSAPDSTEFPWRYTIGKEEVWHRWGILSDKNLAPEIDVGNSLRLTYPPSKSLKKHFKVAESSTIL
jgi:hypothetical protein